MEGEMVGKRGKDQETSKVVGTRPMSIEDRKDLEGLLKVMRFGQIGGPVILLLIGIGLVLWRLPHLDVVGIVGMLGIVGAGGAVISPLCWLYVREYRKDLQRGVVEIVEGSVLGMASDDVHQLYLEDQMIQVSSAEYRRIRVGETIQFERAPVSKHYFRISHTLFDGELASEKIRRPMTSTERSELERCYRLNVRLMMLTIVASALIAGFLLAVSYPPSGWDLVWEIGVIMAIVTPIMVPVCWYLLRRIKADIEAGVVESFPDRIPFPRDGISAGQLVTKVTAPKSRIEISIKPRDAPESWGETRVSRAMTPEERTDLRGALFKKRLFIVATILLFAGFGTYLVWYDMSSGGFGSMGLMGVFFAIFCSATFGWMGAWLTAPVVRDIKAGLVEEIVERPRWARESGTSSTPKSKRVVAPVSGVVLSLERLPDISQAAPMAKD
jgi:hypothetical protein